MSIHQQQIDAIENIAEKKIGDREDINIEYSKTQNFLTWECNNGIDSDVK